MRTPRILIVDDDAMISGLLAETLEAEGPVVCGIEATEGGAVSAAARERPNLIIINVALAAGDDVRVIEQIHHAGPVPHVFISGERVSSGRQLLLKPFRKADLLVAMDHALAPAGVE